VAYRVEFDRVQAVYGGPWLQEYADLEAAKARGREMISSDSYRFIRIIGPDGETVLDADDLIG
jgi:hypothetical protein